MADGKSIAKAYVELVPTAKGIKGKIGSAMGGDVASAGKEAGGMLGSNLVSAATKIIAAAGLGTIIKNTLDAGGALQQSFGGLDTLYGQASEAAKGYAAEAAKAGISANDYAEQAVSFGAALKQAFEGDVTKAAEAANTAILDMADNSAKMGTDLGAIQTAYQGFAKGNYTMLDNLKLGYGGTKTEMERLLADAENAEKLSGVHYDLSNLGDVYSAIHVVQEDLGLTGVAAQEAAETFSGSMGAMKAAAENVMARLALGEDVSKELNVLRDSFKAFFEKNLLPMLGNIVSQIPQVLHGILSLIYAELSGAAWGMEGIVAFVGNLIGGIANELAIMVPTLLETSIILISNLLQELAGYDWSGALQGFVAGLKDTFENEMGEFAIVETFVTIISEQLPVLLDTGANLIIFLADGILAGLPGIIESAGEILAMLLGAIMEAMPKIWDTGLTLLKSLADGILANLPQIIAAVISVVGLLLQTFLENLPQIISTGMKIIVSLAVGLVQAIPKVLSAIPKIIDAIKKAFSSIKWGEVGINIIKGIADGIVGAGKVLVDAALGAAKAAFNGVKSFFGIKSPSRLMRDQIGKYIPEGIAVGIEGNMEPLLSEMESVSTAVVGAAPAKEIGIGYAGSITPAENNVSTQTHISVQVYGAEGQDEEELADKVIKKLVDREKKGKAVFA